MSMLINQSNEDKNANVNETFKTVQPTTPSPELQNTEDVTSSTTIGIVDTTTTVNTQKHGKSDSISSVGGSTETSTQLADGLSNITDHWIDNSTIANNMFENSTNNNMLLHV
jgi:ABC-type uncharacterized transport system involved in gliding motility auxiliary subunit